MEVSVLGVAAELVGELLAVGGFVLFAMIDGSVYWLRDVVDVVVVDDAVDTENCVVGLYDSDAVDGKDGNPLVCELACVLYRSVVVCCSFTLVVTGGPATTSLSTLLFK